MSRKTLYTPLKTSQSLVILGVSLCLMASIASDANAENKPPLYEWKPYREANNSRPPKVLEFIDPNQPRQNQPRQNQTGQIQSNQWRHAVEQTSGEELLPTPSTRLPRIPQPIPAESIEAIPMEQHAEPFAGEMHIDEPMVPWGERPQQKYGDPGQAYCDTMPSHTRRMDDKGYLGLYWVKAEYLLWDIDGSGVPVLATSSTAGTPRANAGVLGLPTTQRLFGGDEILNGASSGLRLELGIRLDHCAENAITIGYYGFDSETDGFSASQANTPILARPFFSVEPGNTGPNAELVSFPNVLSGNMNIDARSDFEGGDIMLHHALENGCGRRLKVLIGYRYNSLDDSILVRDEKQVLDGSSGLAIGTTLSEFDSFRTENRFHGANIGVMAEARHNRLTLEMLMKLGIGQTNSTAVLSGQTTSTVPLVGGGSDVVVTPAGLLVQGSNSGQYEATEFTMIPELGIILGCNITRRLKATAGYNMIYWSRVARAGDQIDPLVNLSQVAPGGLNGLARPEFDWSWNDFLAHGLSAGLDFRF